MDRAQIESFLADLYERTPGKGLTPDQRREQLISFLSGAADAGGIGSGALDLAGQPDAAKALRDAQAGNEGAAGMGEMLNPLSIISTLYGGVSDLFTDDVAKPELKTRDQFFQERRKPVRSVGEVKAAARAEAMKSDAYKQAVEDGNTKRAERIAAAAERSAEDALKKDAANAGTADTNIQTDYEAYLKDYDRDLEAFYGRSFADRNPEFAKAMPVIGTLGAALLTRGLLGRVAGKTAKAADEVNAARAAGDPVRLAEATAAANQAQPGRLKVAGAYGAGAMVPVEAQMLADVIDKKGLPESYQDSAGEWQPVLARARASERLDPYNHPGKFAEANATALLSGGIGALTGGKLAPSMTPVPRGSSPEGLQAAVEEIVGGINAQKAVAAARQPAALPPNNAPPAPLAAQAPPGPIPGSPAPTAMTPARQSRPRNQLAGPTYSPGSPDQINVQRIIDDILTNGQSVTSPGALAVGVRSAGGAPKLSDAQLTKRAGGTAKEARALQDLGVDIYDPKIRKAILDKIAPGTAGMLSVGGLSNADLDQLLAEIMGGGG